MTPFSGWSRQRSNCRPRRFRPRLEPLEARWLLSADSERFVGRLYQDLLARPADPLGLAF